MNIMRRVTRRRCARRRSRSPGSDDEIVAALGGRAAPHATPATPHQ
jgi:hypothetical protein